jgi:menaquinone-dependent protoporphyrinogen IX oxidase
MASFLILYGDLHGQTATVADDVRSVLLERGHEPTVRHVADTADVDVEAFDAVVVGSPVTDRNHLPEVVSFVEANRNALTSRPTAFFQLSLASVVPVPWLRQGAPAFVERTGWQPDRVGLFAGAVTDTTYGPLIRYLFELVAALTTGDTDTASDSEYTNWDDVEAFTVAFARFVEAETGTRPTDPPGQQRTDAPPESTGWRGGTRVAVLVVGVLLSVYHLVLRPWHLHWGATDEETERRLPGDDLVPTASSETTRAVTVDAPCEEVWPWLVQLGQGRGGFYSYSLLENAVGADIHNVDRIVPELQQLEVGDSIRMAREDYWLQSPLTTMTVVRIDPGRTLVLQGYDGGTWTFHLDPVDLETTRLVVRGRTPADQSVVGRVVRYLVYELPHFVMERGMMRGIKVRAERSGHAEDDPAA